MKANWNVTFERVTPESAEYGDADSRGFIAEDVSFREAIEAWDYYGCLVEANCMPVSSPRWFTAYETNSGTTDSFETGATGSQSLHVPEQITEASRQRLARLVDCYGAK